MGALVAKNRSGWAFVLYLAISVVLILVWNGPFFWSPNVGLFDWHKESYYYSFLRDSLIEYRRVPLSFMVGPGFYALGPALRQSLSYWANPEVLSFSPFLILLPFVSHITFIKIYVFAHMCIGAVGTYVLSRRIGLDVPYGLVLFALCVLNPWLMQHLAIGYVPWVNACFVPLIVAALISPSFGIKELVWASVLNALILYQGGLHIFIWLNGTILLFSLVRLFESRSLRSLQQTALYLLASSLLCAPKLFATFSAYSSFQRDPGSSYSSLSDIWGLLMDKQANPHQLPAAYDIYGTNFYDGSLYVGAGFLLLLGLALLSVTIRWIRADTSSARPRDALRLLIVALVLLVIGWGDVWRGIASVLPFLGVERFPWRFLAIALGLLNVFLVKELFFWSKRSGLWSLGILLALVPVFVSSYQRNQLYVTIATSREAPYGGPVLDVALGRLRAFGYSAEEGKLGELKVRAALDRVEIEPPREEDTRVLVSWLAVGFRGLNHVPSFNFENAEIAGTADNRLLLRARDPTRPILVSPKQYGLWPLMILALSGYGLLISLLSWRWKVNPYQTHAKQQPG